MLAVLLWVGNVRSSDSIAPAEALQINARRAGTCSTWCGLTSRDGAGRCRKRFLVKRLAQVESEKVFVPWFRADGGADLCMASGARNVVGRLANQRGQRTTSNLTSFIHYSVRASTVIQLLPESLISLSCILSSFPSTCFGNPCFLGCLLAFFLAVSSSAFRVISSDSRVL